VVGGQAGAALNLGGHLRLRRLAVAQVEYGGGALVERMRFQSGRLHGQNLLCYALELKAFDPLCWHGENLLRPVVNYGNDPERSMIRRGHFH
jgi:hypothetical protein